MEEIIASKRIHRSSIGQTEDALHVSEERFRSAIRNAPVNVSNQNLELRYTWVCNPLQGYSPEDVIGKTDTELLPSETAQIVNTLKHKVIAAGTGIREDVSMPFGDQMLYYDCSVEPLRDAHGNIAGVTSVMVDITERKREVEELRCAKKEWERVFASVPDLITIIDNQHRVLRVNDAMSIHLDLKPDNCVGLRCYEVVHGTSVPPECCPHLRTLGDGCKHVEELYVDRFGGDFVVTTTPLLDEKGECTGSVHIAHDISEMKRMNEALAKSTERLSLALVSSGMATFDWDIVNNKRTWDDNVHSLLGTNPETFSGSAEEFFLAIHPDDRALVQVAQSKAIETNGEYKAEYRAVWPDGTIHHIAASGKVYCDRTGRAIRMAGVCWDISERKLADEALKKLNVELEKRVAERTEELAANIKMLKVEIAERRIAKENVLRLNRLHAVLSETNQAIVRTKDRETLFNDFCRIAVEDGNFKLAWVGLVDEEVDELRIVAAKGVTGYLDNITITVNDEPAGIGPTGISVREGTYYICNDFLGSTITRPWHERAQAHGIRASASIALKQENRVVGALTLYADKKDFFDRQQVELLQQMGADVSFALDNIVRENHRQEAERALREETTERLRAMEALREKEHMLIQQSRQAAMGEMIGNIAHQWRQPLNSLGLEIQRLLLFYDLGECDREFLNKGVNSSMELIRHMSQTIDDFRNYFMPDKEKAEFQVFEVINNTISLLDGCFKHPRINVEIVAKHKPIVNGYQNEFAQVILNILINARDAIVERKIKDPRVMIILHSEHGGTVVTVADNAGGIPEDILGKIFDPYFTTKGPQSGTGVGLFMSKAIIENNMGGRLTASNHADGAEFRIEVNNGNQA